MAPPRGSSWWRRIENAHQSLRQSSKYRKTAPTRIDESEGAVLFCLRSKPWGKRRLAQNLGDGIPTKDCVDRESDEKDG